MFFRSGKRSRIFASFSQPVSSVTMALAPEFDSRNSSASSPNSANSGIDTRPERNAARCAIGNSSDCDRNTATRSPRTRPSCFSTLAKRRENSLTSSNEVRVACAVLVDIDQRQPSAAVGMAVAAHGGDVEPRRDVPAEVAVEGFVVGGFGEHERRFRILHILQTHQRRPRGTRGPITTGLSCGRCASTSGTKSRLHGVWVPAFAGTTKS